MDLHSNGKTRELHFYQEEDPLNWHSSPTTISRLLPLMMIPLAMVLGVAVLTMSMHRMKPRAQFLILVVLGVVIGFTFFAMVQLPQFPLWLGVSLMMAVLTASPFAVRTFMRSLIQDDERANETEIVDSNES
jgi:protein-S-isoprenylcysteine O-methyltransferase Ste14